MTTSKLHIGYVLTAHGTYLVQIPDESQWGFALASASQSWPGGFGVATSWEPIAEKDVPAKVRERLGWILDEHR